MRLRVSTAILVGLFFSSFAIAQEPLSHFDISGNLSFNGASLPSAPSSTTQVRAIGWQTTGVTRFNRWFALTSQFGSSTASSDSMQLIGFTGPGTMRQYSALAGPRITIPTKGRFNPFVEGLVGADRASTSLVSNGTSVTGREVQLAYALGGGAQINLSRHFGLNFEAQYFDTQDSIAFTGWQPAHFQVAAGVVIRMFNRTPQIAEQHTSPTLNGEVARSVATENTQVPVPPTNSVTTVQAVSAVPAVEQAAQLQATVASSAQVASAQPAMIAPSEPSPHATSAADGQNMTAVVIPTTSQVVVPAAQTSGTGTQQPNTTAMVIRPAPVVPAMPTSVTKPVQAFAQAQAPPPAGTSLTAPDTNGQAESEPAPISLGEYARRLREKKQQQQNR